MSTINAFVTDTLQPAVFVSDKHKGDPVPIELIRSVELARIAYVESINAVRKVLVNNNG